MFVGGVRKFATWGQVICASEVLNTLFVQLFGFWRPDPLQNESLLSDGIVLWVEERRIMRYEAESWC